MDAKGLAFVVLGGVAGSFLGSSFGQDVTMAAGISASCVFGFSLLCFFTGESR